MNFFTLPTQAPVTDKRGILTLAWLRWMQDVKMMMDTAAALRESGATADRPTEKLWIGRPFFDTTLGHRIEYDGTNWVDGAGTTV